MSTSTTSHLRTIYTLLEEAPGLRLIHLPDDDVAFLEISDYIPFHPDDLTELLSNARKYGFKAPASVLIEEAWLFGDIFKDRVVLVKDEEN